MEFSKSSSNLTFGTLVQLGYLVNTFEEEITATQIQNVCIVLPPSKFLDLKVFKHMS